MSPDQWCKIKGYGIRRDKGLVLRLCSNDAMLPTGVIGEDETGHMDRGGLWNDVTETVVVRSTLFQDTHLVSFSFVLHLV
ncbi:hypothetical protein TNCV_2324931 [Trichonephila clavipes]|nr:hypothetical protein TNCV_2324931 [Trichonephila clavipes]